MLAKKQYSSSGWMAAGITRMYCFVWLHPITLCRNLNSCLWRRLTVPRCSLSVWPALPTAYSKSLLSVQLETGHLGKFLRQVEKREGRGKVAAAMFFCRICCLGASAGDLLPIPPHFILEHLARSQVPSIWLRTFIGTRSRPAKDSNSTRPTSLKP